MPLLLDLYILDQKPLLQRVKLCGACLILPLLPLYVVFLGSSRVRTDNLSQWQSLITHRGPYDPCNGLQLVLAALLGQVYAALSKVSSFESACHVHTY
jgi:hypothetical protein